MMLRATLENAKNDLDRYSTLVAQGAIPQQTYDTALMNYQKAQAAYDRAVANLSDTTITSPMDGTVIGTPLKAGPDYQYRYFHADDYRNGC